MATITRQTEQGSTVVQDEDGTWTIEITRFMGQIDRLRMMATPGGIDEASVAMRKLVKRMSMGFFGLTFVHSINCCGTRSTVVLPCNQDPEPFWLAAQACQEEVSIEELHSRTGMVYARDSWSRPGQFTFSPEFDGRNFQG